MPLNCLTYPVVRGSVAFNSLHRHYHKSIYFVTNQDKSNNIVVEEALQQKYLRKEFKTFSFTSFWISMIEYA